MQDVDPTSTAARRSLRRRAALIAITAIVVLAVSAIWRPSDDGFVVCLWRRATTLPCPSCGLTRAFCAMSRGEFEVALEYNLLSPALYATLWLVLGLATLELALGRELLMPMWRRSQRVLVPVILCAMAIVWILQLFEHFSS